jgi:hypothetical protein
MIGDCNDCLVFELQSLPGASKVTIRVVTLFSLASEVCTKLFRCILWENIHWVDGPIMEVKHDHILFLFGSSINLYSTTRLLLPLTARGIVFICIACFRVVLASVMLFGCESGVGSGTRCTIHGGTPFIFPWSAGLGIILRFDDVGSNRTGHDHDSGHGSLMQVDLIAKHLQDC